MKYTEGMLKEYRKQKTQVMDPEGRMETRRRIYEAHLSDAASDLHREHEAWLFMERTPDLTIHGYIQMVHLFSELYSK